MSSNDLENDIKPQIPAKRMRLEEKDADNASQILSNILKREIENEIKLRKSDLDSIEESIYITKQYLLRLKQGVVTDYYKQRNQKECLQYPPHPAIKDTFLGKSLRGYIKNEVPEGINIDHRDFDLDEQINKESINIQDNENISADIFTALECAKPPCYIPPKPLKDESVKPPEPRGYVFKKHLRIVVGNVSKWLAPEESVSATHKWTVYTKSADLNVDLSDFVSKVVFFLHPSYKPNDVISITEAPFKLTRRGWGEFPLKARFHFKSTLDVPVDVMHMLKLDHKHTGLETFGAETTLSVWIHLPSKEENIKDFSWTSAKTEEIIDESTNVFSVKEHINEERDEIPLIREAEIKADDVLNNTFTIEENSSSFLVDEQQFNNFSLSPDFLNSFSNNEYKSINLPDFLDFNFDENVSDLTGCQPKQFPTEYSEETSLSSNLPDDFLEECNFVESEIVIDCNEENSSTAAKSEQLIINTDKNSIIEEINDSDGKIDSAKNVKDSYSLNLDFEDEDAILKSSSNSTFISKAPPLKLTNLETASPSSHKKEEKSEILEENKVRVKQHPLTLPSPEGFIQSVVKLDSNQTQEGTTFVQKSERNDSNVKNKLKENAIYLAKSLNKPVNIIYSKFPKQIILKKLNGGIQTIIGTINQENKQEIPFKISDVNSPSNISVIEPRAKPSLVTGETQNSNCSQSKIVLTGNICVNSNLRQEKTLLDGPALGPLIKNYNKSDVLENKLVSPSTSSPSGNSRKKRKLNTKEIKSTIIMLQKENGQVILRKEAKFKECKDHIKPGNSAKDTMLINSEGLKIQAQTPVKNKLLKNELPAMNVKSPSSKSHFLKLHLPLSNSNNSPTNSIIEGKRILFFNQKAIKIANNPLLPKNLPPVNLLKSLNQEASPKSLKAEEVTDDFKESVLLKRCPTQSTEVAVSWLIKRFPLVDSRAQLAGFRCKHPYCAKSREDYLKWPFPKQRAAEWMRAKAVRKLLNMLPVADKWSTLEIWDWARIRAYTPMEINSDLGIPPASSSIQYFYNQPTDEIIDFIKRCKDLKEKEVIDVINSEESPNIHYDKHSSSDSRKTCYEFDSEPDKGKIPFEPELQDMRMFINKCQNNVGAITSPELLSTGILYPSAERILISVFNSVAEDIIRRAHNASWIRHDDNPPPEINIDDIKSAIVSRTEFDILVPVKTEKKERPPVTVLPNFS